MARTKSRTREFRYGLIKSVVAIRQTKGVLQYTVSVVRLYRNGDQWKESTRFGPDDIPVLRLVLDKAYGWILLQKQAAVEAHPVRR